MAESEVKPFLGVIEHALHSEHTFADSMIAGYTAVLSSPGFLYFDEMPGRLADRALAERLSYFLWNSTPDAELRGLADRGELHRPRILAQQTQRLLNDPRSRRFIDDFLNYWLDLRLIEGTAPDAEEAGAPGAALSPPRRAYPPHRGIAAACPLARRRG